MKLFIPLLKDGSKAERVWTAVRLDLAERGLPTTARRIQALACLTYGSGYDIAVGGVTPDGYGPIIVILEAGNRSCFYVCTVERGIAERLPYVVAQDKRWRAVEFDREAGRRAVRNERRPPRPS